MQEFLLGLIAFLLIVAIRLFWVAQARHARFDTALAKALAPHRSQSFLESLTEDPPERASLRRIVWGDPCCLERNQISPYVPLTGSSSTS